MIGQLAVRSLTAHPVRSAVLAAGFGVGVAVMAILLGIAEIVLEQSRAPALVGGGDVLITLAPQVPGRLVLAGTLQAETLRRQIRVAAPSHTTTLYLFKEETTEARLKPGTTNGDASAARLKPGTTYGDASAVRVQARGGIPSLERALGDPETSGIAAWRDSADDVAWTSDAPENTLRYIDRFHPVPDVAAWSSSWAEWLYFNGRSGEARFYLTFLAGPVQADGRRSAGVRLQLDRNGKVETFAEGQPITEAEALRAPDLTIGASSVRLEGMRYRIRLDLRDANGRRVQGELVLEASAGRLIPPIEISGIGGWRTGYVVPVMSGSLSGSLDVDGETVSLADGTGYHDHNWGFWQGVSWQWGQVQHEDLSLLYGRVFPPPEAADPERIPGFVGVLGPEGPLGYTSSVRITETNDAEGRPQRIVVQAGDETVNVTMTLNVESAVVTRSTGSGPLASGLDFLQLRGIYTVTGRAGGRSIGFTGPGSAETFRGATEAPARAAP